MKLTVFKSNKDPIVKVSTIALNPPTPSNLYGIELNHLEKFKKDLLDLQVDGVRARCKYQIPWQSSSPVAFNFQWNILENKVV